MKEKQKQVLLHLKKQLNGKMFGKKKIDQDMVFNVHLHTYILYKQKKKKKDKVLEIENEVI